ncbi:MAG: FtsX domain-containing protein [Lachnoclostridium sp.]
MKQPSFFLMRMSVCNLKRKIFRTVCLIFLVAVLGFTLFGGFILTSSLKNGMASMKNRLGADLMVVPKGYEKKTEGILLKGDPNYFYFNQSLVPKIAQAEGVLQVTGQFFLTSLSEDCCTVAVQLIGFNPDTDFVIQPWISKTYSGFVEDGQLIIGSDITPEKDNTLILFGKSYPVAAQLEKTATGLDYAVFMNMNTMQRLFFDAKKAGINFLAEQDPQKSVSTVLVKIDKNYDPKVVAQNIYSFVSDIEVIIPKIMLNSISNNLESLVVYIRILAFLLWFLSIVILTILFSVTIHERKKEFALLRVLGATRKKLIRIILTESLYVSLLGGIFGIILASMIVFPFSAYIGDRLQLPYLQPQLDVITDYLILSLFFTFITGPLSSVAFALKISRAETYITMRKGE